jgi:DNA-binding GntR family transcriptional regulator
VAAPKPQPLDQISLDVAQMIDPEAAAAAWDRYRRGEANAFTRRLYLGRGGQTFDEIKRRYRLDPEFHAAVDRYMQEFERLLADIGKDGHDDATTRTYLGSETGKVYTMLAHAAGRLG